MMETRKLKKLFECTSENHWVQRDNFPLTKILSLTQADRFDVNLSRWSRSKPEKSLHHSIDSSDGGNIKRVNENEI